MAARSVTLRLVMLALLAISIVLATAWLGLRWVSWSEITNPTGNTSIFWDLRLPRSLLAGGAGAGLALGGAIFQALFRNPLAEPYTLGIASGASLAAAIGFLTGWGGLEWAGIPSLTLLAFGGALVAMSMVYLLYRLRGGKDIAHLLLAGLCLAYVCSAGILLVHFLADRAITNDIVKWMMGSLGTHRPRAALEVAVIFIPVLLLALWQHRALDLLHFGTDLARARGVSVDWTVWTSFAAVGLLVAVIVANCGPIGFVGLMVPHIARLVVGVRMLPLAIASAALGAVLLAVCDGLARSLFVVELPVGVVTNIVGAAFFLYLLMTRDLMHLDTTR